MIYGENITSPIQNELEDFELFHFHDMINFFAYSVMSVGRFWIIKTKLVCNLHLKAFREGLKKVIMITLWGVQRGSMITNFFNGG